MTQRLTKLDAAARLDVSPSTIDRMIQRNELTIEKEPRGSRHKVWVLLEDDSPEEPAAGAGDAADIAELATLRERVRSLEELDAYHREQLKEAELRFQLLLQQLDTSQRTLESLTRALPAPDAVNNTDTRRSWWPFRKGPG